MIGRDPQRPSEALAHGVERARTDVTVDDAERTNSRSKPTPSPASPLSVNGSHRVRGPGPLGRWKLTPTSWLVRGQHVLSQESTKALLRCCGWSDQNELVTVGFQRRTFDEKGAMVRCGEFLGRSELEVATDVVDEGRTVHTIRQLQTSAAADIGHSDDLSDEGARDAALGRELPAVLFLEPGMCPCGRAVLLSVFTMLGRVLEVDRRRVVGSQAVEIGLSSRPDRTFRRGVVAAFLLSGALLLALRGVIMADRRSLLGVDGLAGSAASPATDDEHR